MERRSKLLKRKKMNMEHEANVDFIINIANMKAEFDKTKKELKILRVSYDEITEENNNFRRRIEDLENERSQLKRDLKAANIEIINVNERLKNTENQRDVLDEQYSLLRDKVRGYEKEIDVLTDKSEKLENQFNDCSNRLKETKNALDKKKDIEEKYKEIKQKFDRTKVDLEKLMTKNYSNEAGTDSKNELKDLKDQEMENMQATIDDLKERIQYEKRENMAIVEDYRIKLESIQSVNGTLKKINNERNVDIHNLNYKIKGLTYEVEMQMDNVKREREKADELKRQFDFETLHLTEKMQDLTDERDKLLKRLSSIEIEKDGINLDLNTATHEISDTSYNFKELTNRYKKISDYSRDLKVFYDKKIKDLEDRIYQIEDNHVKEKNEMLASHTANRHKFDKDAFELESEKERLNLELNNCKEYVTSLTEKVTLLKKENDTYNFENKTLKLDLEDRESELKRVKAAEMDLRRKFEGNEYLSKQVEELKLSEESLSKENKELKKQLSKETNTKISSQSTLTDKEKRLQKLETEHASNTQELQDLRSRTRAMQDELESNKDELSNNAKLIVELKTQNESLRYTNEKLDINLRDISGKYEALRKDFSTKDVQRIEFSKENAEMIRIIDSTNEKIAKIVRVAGNFVSDMRSKGTTFENKEVGYSLERFAGVVSQDIDTVDTMDLITAWVEAFTSEIEVIF